MSLTLAEREAYDAEKKARERAQVEFGRAKEDINNFIYYEISDRVKKMVEIHSKYPSVSFLEIFKIWGSSHGWRWPESMNYILTDRDPLDGRPANGKYIEKSKDKLFKILSEELDSTEDDVPY